MTITTATYVFGLIAHSSKPRVRRSVGGLPDGGVVRLVAIRRGWWLAVSDVPLSIYGAEPLKERLRDLDWVSAVAVAHEQVVESFLAADAVLPMKLFTIFLGDERAREHILEREAAIEMLITKVTRKEEWGVRVAMRRTVAAPGHAAAGRVRTSGAGYLQQKKAQRDAVVHRAKQARAVALDLFETLAQHAVEARRRPATELSASGGRLVLDAAFLVPRSRTARLKAACTRQARALAPQGFDISLTGPWPAYSFVQD